MMSYRLKSVICGVALLLLWQLVAIIAGDKDNHAIAQLQTWNAEVVRWSSVSPVSILCDFSDELGEVQSVTFVDREIGEEEIAVLSSLKSCISLEPVGEAG